VDRTNEAHSKRKILELLFLNNMAKSIASYNPKEL
jgi:hypothetical protein